MLKRSEISVGKYMLIYSVCTYSTVCVHIVQCVYIQYSVCTCSTVYIQYSVCTYSTVCLRTCSTVYIQYSVCTDSTVHVHTVQCVYMCIQYVVQITLVHVVQYSWNVIMSYTFFIMYALYLLNFGDAKLGDLLFHRQI